MRRTFLVLSAVLTAVTMSAFSAVLAQAQAVDQYDDAGGNVSEADTDPNPPAPKDSASRTSAPPEGETELTREGLDERVTNSVKADPYSQIVDNATRGRFSAPGWRRVKDPSAYGGGYVRSGKGRKPEARFEVEVPETGYYTVYARWPGASSNTSDARFGVQTADGVKTDSVDQRPSGTEWVTVGFYKLKEGAKRSVVVSPGPGGDTVADAVAISENVLVGANAQMVSVGDPDLQAGAGERSSDGALISPKNDRGERRSIMRVAKSYLGRPYDYDYSSCRKGMRRLDCSCYTRTVFLKFGKKLPDSPVRQWNYGKRHPRSNTERGDLVFQDLNKDGRLNDHYDDHVSIWSGNGNVIHASSYFGKVVEGKQRYLDNYWGTRRLQIK